MTVNYPPPLLSTTTAHSSLLTSEFIPAVAKITGPGVGGERLADVRDCIVMPRLRKGGREGGTEGRRHNRYNCLCERCAVLAVLAVCVNSVGEKCQKPPVTPSPL